MYCGKTTLASINAGAFVSKELMQDQITVITGQTGVGKSTWCQEAATQARAEGFRIGGLLSPAIYENGRKVGIGLLDLQTGGRYTFAKRKPDAQEGTGCQWEFDPQAIEWANRVLRSIGCVDVVFIDELGPLELVRGGGFQEGLRLLDEGRYASAFVVVRPSLLGVARKRWPNMHLIRLSQRSA